MIGSSNDSAQELSRHLGSGDQEVVLSFSPSEVFQIFYPQLVSDFEPKIKGRTDFLVRRDSFLRLQKN